MQQGTADSFRDDEENAPQPASAAMIAIGTDDGDEVAEQLLPQPFYDGRDDDDGNDLQEAVAEGGQLDHEEGQGEAGGRRMRRRRQGSNSLRRGNGDLEGGGSGRIGSASEVGGDGDLSRRPGAGLRAGVSYAMPGGGGGAGAGRGSFMGGRPGAGTSRGFRGSTHGHQDEDGEAQGQDDFD